LEKVSGQREVMLLQGGGQAQPVWVQQISTSRRKPSPKVYCGVALIVGLGDGVNVMHLACPSDTVWRICLFIESWMQDVNFYF